MRNKELEALKRVESRLDTEDLYLFENDLKIIKSALKRLDYIDENKLYCISENYLQDIKKIKAFDVIKKHCIDVGTFCDFDTYQDYCEEYGEPDDYIPTTQAMSEDEFDLLKEVLL